jgi:hypothetical protein
MIEEAYEIDKETGTEHWYNAIMKEIKNNMIAFQFLEPGKQVPVGTQCIPLHMIFDVKLDSTRKARYIAGGTLDQATHTTYIFFCCNLRKCLHCVSDCSLKQSGKTKYRCWECIQVPARDKFHTTAGPEFGPHRCRQMVIIVMAIKWCCLACTTKLYPQWHGL